MWFHVAEFLHVGRGEDERPVPDGQTTGDQLQYQPVVDGHPPVTDRDGVGRVLGALVEHRRRRQVARFDDSVVCAVPSVVVEFAQR